MAIVGKPHHRGTTLQVVGVAGVNDDDIVIELDNVDRFNDFVFGSTAGLMDVAVSLDGTNYLNLIAFQDLMSVAPDTWVIITAVNRLYRFEGSFKSIRISQNAAGAVANAVLICGQGGRTR